MKSYQEDGNLFGNFYNRIYLTVNYQIRYTKSVFIIECIFEYL